MTEKAKNVTANMFAPVDVRNTTLVGGTVGYVSVEVLVSYILRRVFKIEQRGFVELSAIHTLSIPFIGGLSAFADPNHQLGLEAPFGAQFMDGAKGIPAVFAAQYVVNTFMDGLHMPRLNFKDILITASAKILSRPLMSVLYPQVEMFRSGQDALEETFKKQHNVSNLKQD